MPADPTSVVARFVEEFQTKGDRSVGEELLADDFVNHSPPPGAPPTREAVLDFFDAMHTAFPDLRAVVHEHITEGDRVMTRKSFVGTHHGAFLGISPTGREITIDLIDIMRVRDGRIVEHRNIVDTFGMLQQLGALPG